MKIKIVGFKVGVSRLTANLTLDIDMMIGAEESEPLYPKLLGATVGRILSKSDFISIRRVDD